MDSVIVTSNQFEVAFLNSVKNQLTASLFQAPYSQVETFGNSLKSQAVALQWNDQKIGEVFATFFTLHELKKDDGNEGETGSYDCDCKLEGPTFCTHCSVTPCEKVRGCGWFCLGLCTGTCW